MVASSVSMYLRKAHVLGLIVAAAVIGSAIAVHASEIGIQFYSGQGGRSGESLATNSTTSAGIVSQDNWNTSAASSWTSLALYDNAGASTTATLTGSANGQYFGGGVNTTAGDIMLSSNEIYNGWSGVGTGATLTFSGIPYSVYDVYVYAAIDSSGRNETIELTPTGGSASYQSFTTSGGPSWVIANNPVVGWDGIGTQPTAANATAAEFTGLTASSFVLNYGAPGNGAINGVQIVAAAIPEPATLGIIAIGELGVVLLGRKRRMT